MTTETLTPCKQAEIRDNLDGFTGTEQYHRSGFVKVTDGIAYMAEKCGAWWLVDIVGNYQASPELKAEEFREFQLWRVEHADAVMFDDKTIPAHWVVTCRADSDREPVIKQIIEYSDFPLDVFEFYCIGGIVLLKSEY